MPLSNLTPPHSLEAEQAVLGGLMLDNAVWDSIADSLNVEDFYTADHRAIYRAIFGLARVNSPFDVVTVAEAIEGDVDGVDLAYLGELAKNTPSVANIETYAQIVQERSHLRKLITLGYECARLATAHGASVAEVHETVEKQLFGLAEHGGHAFLPLGQLLNQAIDTIDRRFTSGEELTGVSTGLDDLDRLLGGLQQKDLVIVAARPSMGKTAFALKLVLSALESAPKKTVQIYSLEMPAEQLVFRCMASLAKIDLSRLSRGRLSDEDWPRLTAAVAKLQSFDERLVIDDTAALTPSALRTRARRSARRFGGPSVIMVDYLQLMRSPGKENRNLEIADISASLKALAKEMDCPVIALSQLNRALEQRANKRPVNGDLRESGALEQDADVIMFLYRDEVYHPDSAESGIAEIILGKQRNGPIGTAKVAFIPSETRFENLTSAFSGGAR